MEQELQSKTQEILKLQETLRRQEEEKEDISKLLESAKRQIEGQRSKDLSEPQRTQSDNHGTAVVVEESSGNIHTGSNRDCDNVNSFKSEKDRPPNMSIRSQETCQVPQQKPNNDRISSETQLKTEIWSEEDEMVCSNPILETQNCQSGSHYPTGSGNFFPVTLKNFGLSVFDEDSGDLLTHIEEVNRCAEEAGEMGATEFQKIRLLMLSLPKELKYVENFIPPEKKSKYDDFSGELVRILSDKIRTAMNEFLTSQRRPGESILKYFNRIVQFYKNSNVIAGTDWESDPSHVTGVYTKIYQALSNDEKQVLNMQLDKKLEEQRLTVTELRKVLLDIYKLVQNPSSPNNAIIKSLHLSIMPRSNE